MMHSDENRIRGMKDFYLLGLLGWVIKKIAMSWIMPSIALLLCILISMTACNMIKNIQTYPVHFHIISSWNSSAISLYNVSHMGKYTHLGQNRYM